MTIGRLFQYFQAFEQIKINGSFLEVLFGQAHFHNRIGKFYQNNQIAISGMTRRLNELNDKYFQFEGEGSHKRPIIENGQPKLKPGMKMEDYQKEHHALMSEKCNIII